MMAGFVEAGVNRVLALDPDSAARLLRLQGKSLQVTLEGLEITLFMSFDSGNVSVDLEPVKEPDTTISGTPMALFAMAAPGDTGNWGLPGSSVQISGDANLARDVERIFSQLNPDWEVPLTEILGNVAGYQLASGLKQGAESAREAVDQFAEMTGDWLREESEIVARPEELGEFSNSVDGLSDAIDRLEARIKNLAGKSS
jgi:ubiquinone biosynthesis protein UbiJ